MKCETHNYKQPLFIKVSSVVASILPAVLVGLWLPTETNFLLFMFIVFSVVIAMGKLHFDFIERPHISEWIIYHMEEYHKK